MTIFISVIAVAVAVASVTLFLIYDMRKSKIESVALIAKIAGDRNSAALAFGTQDSIQNNLEIYNFSPSIRAVCIYNEFGLLFGKYRPEKAGKEEQYCLPQFVKLPQTIPGLITVRDEIRHNGMFLGSIYVVSDTREIHSYVVKITQISCAVTTITLLFVLLATFHFSRIFSGPIQELTETIQTITESKNYKLEAKSGYTGEIGILASAFNEMLGEVLRRDKALASANEKLEEKIALRTGELLEAKRRAEEASEAKSEFLRNMSHEFRTPLHAILSFSSYGLSECTDEMNHEIRRYFEQIYKGSERLGNLVNEVLDFAQLEKGSQTFVMHRADLRELASHACEVVAPLIKEKKLMLHIEQHKEPVPVICDHAKIEQVITNLLSNAIKFTPPDKKIVVRTQVISNMAMLSVVDQGIGIPEGEKDAIFESFRQSSRTNTGTGGTGLGLAICKKIIEMHRGKIWAENNAGSEGACVAFILRRQNEETQETEI
ncbi:MAG TPA: ATP-binding protein [Rickettsiales bacterium]|nr:ATP-binding protein [Rickettsiales bacterium]